MKKLLLLVVLIFTLACGKKEEVTKDTIEIKPVKTISITKNPIKQEVVIGSDTTPSKRLDIITTTGGEVVKINFKNGDSIKKGSNILKLHNTSVEARYTKANASLRDAKAELERGKKFAEKEYRNRYLEAKSSYISTTKELEASTKILEEKKKTYDRNVALYKEELISEIEFLRIEGEYEEIRARNLSLLEGGIEEKKQKLELARFRVEEMEWEYDISSLVANYNLALAEYKSAKEDFDDLDIVSNIGGEIVSLDLDLYSEIDSDTMLLSVIDLSTVEVKAGISSRDISSLSLEDKVVVEIDDINVKTSGKITELSSEADLASRMFPITVTIDNLDRSIKSGMYGKVIISSRSSSGWVVPKDALIVRELASYIALIRDKTAYIVKVKRGIMSDTMVEVISDEISSMDRVVISGQYLLEDGDTVSEVK